MRYGVIVAALSLSLIVAPAVEAAGRRTKPAKHDTERSVTRDRQRPSTMDARGLCHRDTGRPFHTLNLSERCDREEFWARFNDRGDHGR